MKNWDGPGGRAVSSPRGRSVRPAGTGSHQGSRPSSRLNSSEWPARGPEDHFRRCRGPWLLPAEVGGQPELVTGVGERRVRGQAVKDDHITGAVPGGAPAALGAGQQPRLPGPVPVAAGAHGETAERGRDLGQREPGGQHVLDSRPHVVAVDVPAAGPLGRGLRRHCAQYLHRVRESLRAQDAADRLAQRRQVRERVERQAHHRCAVRRVGQRLPGPGCPAQQR